MEVLQSDKPLAEIARAYYVHPVTLSKWKQHFEAMEQRCWRQRTGQDV